MAVVLAGADLGPQPSDLRGEPRPAGYFRHRLELRQGSFRRDRGRRILPAGRRPRVFHVPPPHEEGLSADEPAAVFHHAVSVTEHGRVAPEDGAAAVVAHQVCVDYTLVQRVRDIAEIRFQIADFGGSIRSVVLNLKSEIASLKSFLS